MVQYFDEIPEFLFAWIAEQKVFWVATAPLASDGHVNLSPKGLDGMFHVVNSCKVWYVDLTGSGIETVAHLRQNGRITILFNAFEGPPRIARLYGIGKAYEFGTPEYDAILPPETRPTGCRSVIVIDVHKVSTSCGYGVPIMEYKHQRDRLLTTLNPREIADIEAETLIDASPSSCAVPPRPPNGIKNYWMSKNQRSIDGLPGLVTCPDSTAGFKRPKTDQRDIKLASMGPKFSVFWDHANVLVAALMGALLSAFYFKFTHIGSLDH